MIISSEGMSVLGIKSKRPSGPLNKAPTSVLVKKWIKEAHQSVKKEAHVVCRTSKLK